MAKSQDNAANEKSTEVNMMDAAYEEEINLVCYIRILWKWKYFILSITALPTLIVAITMLLLPRSYTLTYVYDVKEDTKDNLGSWALNKINYELLLNRFYNEENLTKLIVALQNNGLGECARRLSSDNQLKGFIQFKAIPSFPDLSNLTITDPDQLNKIRDMKASLLNVTITDNHLDYLYKISSLIRDNIENVIPLYIVQEQLSAVIREYNTKMANIECERFDMRLALKNSSEVLAELKKVNTSDFDNKQNGIALLFNVGEQNQNLPLNYQIQAAESKNISLENSIKMNEEKYEYYKDLLNLNHRILADLNNKLPSDYTIKQFKTFLVDLAASCEEPQIKDYLNAYIRRIENKIAAGQPITEKPNIVPIAKGTAKKSGIGFIASLTISVFAVFLVENRKK
jgi:hypothetical protein